MNEHESHKVLRRLERRRDKRSQMLLPGRIFCAERGLEANCLLVDISPGGATLECPLCVLVDDKIILYVDRLGRFEATVAMRVGTRLSLQFHYNDTMRRKIADKIAQFVSGHLDELPPRLRDAPRIYEPAINKFVWSDGSVSDCEVADISLTGASLRTAARPPLNDLLRIGCSLARVVRYHDEGIAIEFLRGTSAAGAQQTAHSTA